MLTKVKSKRALTVTILGGIVLGMVLLVGGILWSNPFPREAIRNIDYSTSILDKDGQLLKAFTNSQGRWLFHTSLSELNENFIQATLAIEDRRFFQHHGIDGLALIRAVGQNLANRRRISGASTISMQTVRLLENRPRTWSSKLIEAVHTLYLERHYSKLEILRLYFELAPYGGNIHGIKAAAKIYFGKAPKDLTLSESALLAGLPQSPSRLRPDRHPRRAQKRREMVLKGMLRDKVINREVYDLATAEPVQVPRHSMPSEAPHWAQFLRTKYPRNLVVSTLDLIIQHYAEQVLLEAVERLKASRVSNGAVVVIENATGKVRALVGSADFAAEEEQGQVNGAISLRSPGSALKPFTYALGFERGLYSTESLIDDSPLRFGTYLPRNYDEEFRGPVTLREALVDSLNIPAVEVLDRVGYGTLYSLLRKAGLTTLTRSPEDYGVALTLGSAEVTLLELTNAYAMLARLGIYKPVQFLENSAAILGERILSEGAAYIVTDILSDTSRLQDTGAYRDEKRAPRIAFKTGTSYGQRDAWTIAYNSEYTIGVWFGNFSGRSSRSLVGLEVATPIAVKLFDWLYQEQAVAWYEQPESIGLRAKNDLYVKSVAVPIAGTHEISDRDRPKIISPAGGATYFLSGPAGNPQEIQLSARPGSGVSELFWFLDGKLLKRAAPGEKVLWNMPSGQYQLTCADNFGRSSTVLFTIR